jgi:hypothetical protein
MGDLDDQQPSDRKITELMWTPGVVGDGATRLVEPGPRLPDKLKCGQHGGARRFRQTGRPGEACLVTGGGHSTSMAA